MARFSAIINQFNGGMVTQRMNARTNLEIWPKSCREVVNFIPTVWGGNKFRGGTRYVEGFGKCHLVPFVFNNDIAYVVAFGDELCRFYRNNKPVLKEDGSVLQIRSPFRYEDITGPNGECLIKYQQSADVLYLATGKTPLNKLMRLADNDFAFSQIEFKNGPFEDKEFFASESSSIFSITDNKNGVLKFTGEDIATDYLVKSTTGNNYDDLENISQNNLFSICKLIRVEDDGTEEEVSVGPEKRDDRYFPNPLSYLTSFLSSNNTGLYSKSNPNDSSKIKLFATFKAVDSWSGKKVKLVFSWRTVDRFGSTSSKRKGEIIYSGVFSIKGEAASEFGTNLQGRAIRLYLNGRDIKSWGVSKAYTEGNVVKSDDKYYVCATSGTSGNETPVHTSGTVSDGGVNWTFINFGYIDGIITEEVSGSEIKIFFEDYELYDWYATYGFDAYQIGLIGGNSTNYPTSVFFFNERLGLGINTNLLPKVCFSQSGDYENFDPLVEGETLAESAVTVELAVGETDTINWCTASSEVLVATDSNFTVISPATTTEPFGPENIKVDYLTSDGANIVNPVQVGKKVMYIDEKGKSLFSNGYDWESNGFRNIKASWVAEDLFEEGIIGLSYQKDPDFSVWALTAKGNLICFTYEPDQNVSAFSYHYTDGVIKSICSIPSYDGKTDELWLCVERTNALGKAVYFIEVMQAGLPLNIDRLELRKTFSVKEERAADAELAKGSWFVDCGIEKTSGTAFSEVDGLEHLEGKTVTGLADGKYVEPTLVEGGKIALKTPALRAIIGLPYSGYFIPNGIDAGAQSGTSQAKTQRISQLTLRVYRSSDFKCGDGYKEQNIRLNEQPDGSLGLFTGDYRFAFPGTYSDRYNKITSALVVVKQDKPFPLCVNGLVADMETIDG